MASAIPLNDPFLSGKRSSIFPCVVNPTAVLPVGLAKHYGCPDCPGNFLTTFAGGVWSIFCGSFNLEQVCFSFVQNIGSEHISSTKMSTISKQTSCQAKMKQENICLRRKIKS